MGKLGSAARLPGKSGADRKNSTFTGPADLHTTMIPVQGVSIGGFGGDEVTALAFLLARMKK